MLSSKRLLILAVIISFVFGHFGRLLWPGTLFGRLNPLDLVVLAALFMTGLKINKSASFRWWLLFLALAALSFVWGLSLFSLSGQTEAFFYLLRLAIYGLFIMSAGRLFAADWWRLAAAIGSIMATLALLQWLFWPSIPVSFTAHFGLDPHSGRAFGTLFDPNFLAALLVLTLLATAHGLTRSQISFNSKIVLALGGSLQLIALLLTGSRSGWLMALIAAIFWLLVVYRQALPLLAAAVMVVFLLFPSVSSRIRSALALDQTATARLDSWQTAGEIIDQSPLLGVGYNNYQRAATAVGRFQPVPGHIALAANGSDSSWLTIWALGGLFGLVGWLFFWLAAARTAGAVALASIAGLLLNSWFINSALFPFILFLMALNLQDKKEGYD